ncbi:MAG: hypothetical protein IPL32_05030 [Chloracidobacterium sp.]|nr:hypothetical protein [Chloracidobacterium sp.]
MAEFQFRIEDLRLWAPQEAEILQWPDRVPIYDNNSPTEHRAFLTGHTYVYTLPHDLEQILKRGEGEILPHFEDLADDLNPSKSQRQRLTHLFFHESASGSDIL